MLPQHGGVPNFSLRIPGPILLLFALVLLTGGMLTLSFHLNAEPGDLAAQSRVKLSLIITLLLSVFILLAGSGRWLHPHLWKHGNSQRQHRHRRGKNSRRNHRRH
jgi:hypothetical protein